MGFLSDIVFLTWAETNNFVVSLSIDMWLDVINILAFFINFLFVMVVVPLIA